MGVIFVDYPSRLVYLQHSAGLDPQASSTAVASSTF